MKYLKFFLYWGIIFACLDQDPGTDSDTPIESGSNQKTAPWSVSQIEKTPGKLLNFLTRLGLALEMRICRLVF
jgi:hypothetical protein